MSTTVSVDGTSYEVPEDAERGWGTEVSNLIIALADSSLLIKGGSIPLTSEADFGTNFGLKSIYFKTGTALPAAAGVLRLANADTISWRNAANDADLVLKITTERMQYEGSDVVLSDSTDTLTNKGIDADTNTITNIDTAHLSAGTLIVATDLTGAADTNWPSTLAVKTYVDDSISANDDASEITYTPTTAADWPNPDPTSVQAGLDQLAAERTLETDFTAHTGDAANPHTVTATQVGLGNNDNTSDADKPISTLTQTALDAKEPTLPLTTRGDVLIRDAANATARLAVGTNLQVLTSNGTDISWQDPSGGGGGEASVLVTNDDSTEAGAVTILAGKRRWESEFDILVADTWTVAATAKLVVEGSLTVSGSLVVNGSCRIF
jgi:hypothetical protein